MSFPSHPRAIVAIASSLDPIARHRFVPSPHLGFPGDPRARARPQPAHTRARHARPTRRARRAIAQTRRTNFPRPLDELRRERRGRDRCVARANERTREPNDRDATTMRARKRRARATDALKRDRRDETAEMNKWRAVSMLVIPACAGFGVYTLSNAAHGHGHENPAYSYLRIRNREQFPWGGDCGLFEYRDDCK